MFEKDRIDRSREWTSSDANYAQKEIKPKQKVATYVQLHNFITF